MERVSPKFDNQRRRLILSAMAFAGSSQLQLLLTLQFPDGMVKWGARTLPSMSRFTSHTSLLLIQLSQLISPQLDWDHLCGPIHGSLDPWSLWRLWKVASLDPSR
jgi:hypothetical protein